MILRGYNTQSITLTHMDYFESTPDTQKPRPIGAGAFNVKLKPFGFKDNNNHNNNMEPIIGFYVARYIS